MRSVKRLVSGFVLGAVMLIPAHTMAGGLAKAIVRGATKSVSKTWSGAATRTLRRDLVRDRAARVRPLAKDRTVFRYTSKAQARNETRKGIQPGSHMTSHTSAGRPLSPARAQRRYGLPRKPEVRATIRIPQGQPVRVNKAIGGRPGIGEFTSTKRVPRGAIEKVVPLR